MMTVKIVCIEVALLFSHKEEKTSLFSEDQLKSVRKSSLTPVFNWKSALNFFPTTTVKTVCIEVALLISHKDEKFSLFSVDQLKCVRKSSLTSVFERKSALKIFPLVTVNIICIEVAHLFSHKDGKNSLFSEEKLECVRKNSLTPVFKWKSALKKTGVRELFLTLFNWSSEKSEVFSSLWLKRSATSIQTIFTVIIGKTFSADFHVFPMMTVKTVCIEVATLISHKDQKTSPFSEDQKKCKKKSSHSRI